MVRAAGELAAPVRNGFLNGTACAIFPQDFNPFLFWERRMARAFIGSTECVVTVDRDLGEGWAVAVRPADPKISPLVVKLQGNDREKITRGALEILQKSGKIDRFEA